LFRALEEKNTVYQFCRRKEKGEKSRSEHLVLYLKGVLFVLTERRGGEASFIQLYSSKGKKKDSVIVHLRWRREERGGQSHYKQGGGRINISFAFERRKGGDEGHFRIEGVDLRPSSLEGKKEGKGG